ncbi:hypothetical protein SGLAM104S_03119 [Streptomyces glaucescens]
MLSAPPLCCTVNATTAAAPARAAVQKVREGRVPTRRADSAAVVSGSSPTTTAACEVVEVCSASVVSIGKPRTTPAATTASPGRCLRSGSGMRRASRQPPAISAASTLRTATSDQGPKPSRPQAVAGKVREKATTPSAAWRVPAAPSPWRREECRPLSRSAG